MELMAKMAKLDQKEKEEHQELEAQMVPQVPLLDTEEIQVYRVLVALKGYHVTVKL